MKALSMTLFVAVVLTVVGQTDLARADEQEKIRVSESQKLGKYLADDEGHAIYLFTADAKGESNCNAACAKMWPPVTTTGKPVAEAGVDAGMLGTIKRADGTTQVTYNGMPLYYYAQDKKAGSTMGEELKQFGGKWYLVSPEGKEVEGD
jgi:predicted lipoprotein with Yx(FWY)xxD motif